MNLTNINDPAGVQALLEQLRTSQAWQDAIAASTPIPEQAQPAPKLPQDQGDNTPSSTNSVTALLSQLQAPPSWSPQQSVPDRSNHATYPTPSGLKESASVWAEQSKESVSEASQTQDLKGYTFQQALPVLAQLSDDVGFITTIKKLKQDQDDLERKLWEERMTIQKKYEEKVKVAQTKATMIGVGLSKHEADMMVSAYKRELERFDLERVLPSWDGLVSSQQSALASHGVPTMFNTSSQVNRERQQKVVQVIEGIIGKSEP